MKNEFVPYNIALTMKELGFDELTLAAYVDNELEVGGIWKDSVKSKVIHKAPLYQQLFRWFRDEHNLHPQFAPYPNGYEYMIFNSDGISNGYTYSGSKNYKEAELACLRKLIEIVNQNK